MRFWSKTPLCSRRKVSLLLLSLCFPLVSIRSPKENHSCFILLLLTTGIPVLCRSGRVSSFKLGKYKTINGEEYAIPVDSIIVNVPGAEEKNSGLEGITFDPLTNHLILANEKVCLSPLELSSSSQQNHTLSDLPSPTGTSNDLGNETKWSHSEHLQSRLL